MIKDVCFNDPGALFFERAEVCRSFPEGSAVSTNCGLPLAVAYGNSAAADIGENRSTRSRARIDDSVLYHSLLELASGERFLGPLA